MSPYHLQGHARRLIMVFVMRLIMVFAILSALSLPSHAGIVQYGDYKQAHEVAKEKEHKMFVICSQCPPVKSLSSITAIFPLAVKAGTAQAGTTGSPKPPSTINPPVRKALSREISQAPSSRTSPGRTTVYFDFDSAVLKDPERNKIDRAVPHGGRVDAVTGYTCDLGSQEYNDRLALKRAESVSSYLKGKEVIPLQVEGKGKCCYVSEERELNRRVEIITPAGREIITPLGRGETSPVNRNKYLKGDMK